MKVGLAASTLSKSVADALDFCREDYKLREFEGNAPTSEFLRTIDKAFDILNSRNVDAKGSKAAMSPNNKKELEKIFSLAINYIAQLKTEKGKLLVTSRQKTGFVGFILEMETFKGLYNDYVQNGPLDYILTYKWSQDHLELFFGALRSNLGDNSSNMATRG